MGWTAVRKLREVVPNVRTCLAVEIMCATQGIGLRSSIATPAAPVAAVHDVVRAKVPAMDVDREVSEQIMAVELLMPDLCAAAAAACGGPRLRIGAASRGGNWVRLWSHPGPERLSTVVVA